MTAGQRWFLRAFAAWTIYVWGTRIFNIVGDETRTGAFKAVHVALAVVSVGFAVGTVRIAGLRRARSTKGQATGLSH